MDSISADPTIDAQAEAEAQCSHPASGTDPQHRGNGMCDELEFPLTRCPAIFMGTARPVGRTGGRPPKLTDDDIEAVKALLVNPDIGVTQIARRLGFSPVTLYQYIPTARTESPWTFEKRRLYQSSSWPRLNGSSRPFSITQPSRWERLFLESKQTHRRSMENGAA